MNLLIKSGLGAILIVGFSASAFAQTFNLLSDSEGGAYIVGRGVGFTLNGVSAGFSPTMPFADLNGYQAASNSPSDYYYIAQNSSAAPTQLICNTYINLQTTIPANYGYPGSLQGGCYISFSVSSPVTADFELSNFNVSNAGVTYDGVTPQAGIFTDDPNFPQGNTGLEGYLLNPNQGNYSTILTFEPNYTYTFDVFMTAFGAPDPTGANPDPVNVAWQENMSLTIDSNVSSVPEPSSVPLLAFGLTALFQLRRLRQHSK